MLRVFVEEAAALASIGLFVGMIAVWAQLIPNDLPLKFHPVAIRVSADVTPFGAV